jgi:lantibiotic biosynthesis protein
VQRSYFRPAGLALFRASASGHRDLGALPWLDGSTDRPAVREFVREAWAADGFASAVELASPGMAAAVAAILRGDALAPEKAARAALSLARYAARMRGRATPFGLFAGVAPAHAGAAADCDWQHGYRAAARAEGQWLAAVVAALEACAPLRRHLRVVANNLVAVRGDRLVVGWLPHASQATWGAQAEISLRRSPAAEAALRLAQSPVAVADLLARLLTELAPATDAQIDMLVGELLACGALVSSLRPPSTVTDGLAHALDALASAGTAGFLGGALVSGLREAHEQLSRADAAGFPGCADRMRALAASPAHPVAADLYLKHQVTVPAQVSAEAAAAASALVRLSPPDGARPVPRPRRHGPRRMARRPRRRSPGPQRHRRIAGHRRSRVR